MRVDPIWWPIRPLLRNGRKWAIAYHALMLGMLFGAFVISVPNASAQATAQDFEYGKPEDLKGLTRYYVDAGIDVKARSRIVEEIQKSIPQLLLAEDVESTEIMLTFMSRVETVPLGATTERLHTGVGTVAIHVRDSGKPRLVLNFTSRQDTKLEKMPYTKFAREFVKAYKKANGLK
jgi:hypothetical protein